MNKVVYNVYENFHHSNGEVGNYNYGTYSTLELAQARMEQVSQKLDHKPGRSAYRNTLVQKHRKRVR